MENAYIQNNVFELCHVPVFAVDRDCRYIFLNTAYKEVVKKSRGLNVTEGDSYIDVAASNSGIDKPRAIEVFGEVMKGKQFQAIDEYGEPDRYRAHYEITYSPVTEPDGNILGMVAVSQDITDRIKLQNKLSEQKQKIEQQEKRLRDAYNAKSKLLSIIAHDLRSPIGNLNLCIQMILEDKLPLNELLKILGSIGRSTGAIKKTLDDLLEWSMIDPQFDKPCIEQIELSDFFNEQINMYTALAKQKKVTLTASASNVSIYADRRQLSLLIRNLIDNAVKFTKKGGLVELGLTREKNGCKIYCTNTGAIADKIKNKILTEAGAVNTNGTSGEKGTGLGLLLCKEILASMNSSLKIRNSNDKTRFSFVLPNDCLASS